MREEIGLSQEQISEKLKINFNEYVAIESGKRNITSSTMDGIAKFFNTDYKKMMYDLSKFSAIDLLSFINISRILDLKQKVLENSKDMLTQILNNSKIEGANRKELETTFDMILRDSVVQIPIYGEIKAGYDFVAEQNIIGYKIASKSEVSDGDYFYLIVKGDSMIEEGIHEGYHVLVKKQNHVSNGKIGVVIVNGDEATLKRVYYDGDNIILQAANKNIPPRVLPIDQVLIQGQVKSVVFDV
jgi:SOS-response transcriptional repressor LexA